MDKVEFTYGRVEARIKVTEGQGLWPAFWMLGADFPEIGWPASGEIDIMENIGREPRSTHGTVHGPEYHGIGGLGMRYIFPEPMAQDFHVFGIEWEPEVIHWTVNGEIFHTMTPESLWGGTWVFDHDFFMLINVAVGGRLGGDPDNTTVFPQTMLVDWVRVYQRVGE
jgi:beta-glucanase (GH16 family)